LKEIMHEFVAAFRAQIGRWMLGLISSYVPHTVL